MGLNITPFVASHTTGIKNLIVPIQQNEFSISISYDDQPDLQDIPGFYQTDNGGFWVALDETKGDAKGSECVVGCIALKDIGNNQAALRKMFVAQSHRGPSADRDIGVAAMLLERLLAHAKIQGLGEIYLGTTAKFLAAHRFYEKNGFALVDENNPPPAFPRMDVDTRFYKIGL